MRYHFGLMIPVLLSACSLVETGDAPSELPKLSYQLYLSRSSMDTTEFEQYKLTPRGLFYECGTIHRGRPQVREQKIRQVGEAEASSANELAHKIFERMSEEATPSLEEPGINSGLADPGKFLLTLSSGEKRVEVKTSLDAVGRSRKQIEEDSKKLAEAVRGIATEAPCGNSDFFGIGRRAG